MMCHMFLRLHLVAHRVRQRGLHDRTACGASVRPAAQSRKLEQNPCGTAAISRYPASEDRPKTVPGVVRPELHRHGPF